MSSFIDTGSQAQIDLAAGHTLVFYVFRDGEATLRAQSGLPGAPYVYGKYTTRGQQTIGPFSTDCVLLLAAAQQDVEYDYGASPSVAGEGSGSGASPTAPDVKTPTAMAGTAMSITAPVETVTIAAATTYTWAAGTPTANTYLTKRFTATGAARVATIPAAYSEAAKATVTELHLPLGDTTVVFEYTAGGWRVYGDPAPAAYSWATKPASGNVGDRIYIDDVGTHGGASTLTEWVWKDVGGVARWYPAQDILWNYGQPATLSVSASAQVGRQAAIPAGLLWVNAILDRHVQWGKTGTTNTLTMTDRVGTAGTVADTALSGHLMTTSNAAHLSVAYWHRYLVTSATVLQAAGMAGSTNMSYFGASQSGAYSTGATTVSDHTANALFFSGCILTNTAADTPVCQNFLLTLKAP